MEIKLTAPSPYQQLCALLQMEPELASHTALPLEGNENLIQLTGLQRMTLALRVLVDIVTEEQTFTDRIDKTSLDYYVDKLDQRMSLVMDQIIHHPKFRQLESQWRSLDWVTAKLTNDDHCICEILSVSSDELMEDFSLADDLTQSGLYKHLYSDEYDMPGGEPFAAVITPFALSNAQTDIALLEKMANLGAMTHCPFISCVSPEFFKKSSWEDVLAIDDLKIYLEQTDYLAWNLLRQNENARYLGLVLPQFLLRPPYDVTETTKQFRYHEKIDLKNELLLWGSSAYAFADRLCDSFIEQGWCVNIRGPQGGGMIHHLPRAIYYDGCGWQNRIPLSASIAEAQELCLSELGFISLSYYKNRDYACFFSANSVHLPASYATSIATANSRINARLPYVFLCSRLAHYLKVLQREAIGSNKTCVQLETEINQWLQTLVTTMQQPSPELAASHPLREARVEVAEIPGKPGLYRVNLYVMPHFQIEGMDVRLALVSQLPGRFAINE